MAPCTLQFPTDNQLSSFVDVVASALEFVRDYRTRTGFQPNGAPSSPVVPCGLLAASHVACWQQAMRPAGSKPCGPLAVSRPAVVAAWARACRQRCTSCTGVPAGSRDVAGCAGAGGGGGEAMRRRPGAGGSLLACCSYCCPVRPMSTHVVHTAAGLATYFVTRPGGKPSGNYQGSPGWSFMLDPITSDPTNPAWNTFLVGCWPSWSAPEHAARGGAGLVVPRR